MKLPTVSVIVPVYNAQATIEKCAMSILENNYRALEVILVNDGSVDGSGLICDQLACRDSRIKVIHKINGGVGSARNEGLLAATGEYLAFVDADDTVSNQIYEKMVRVAQGSAADCVICNITNEYANGKYEERHVFGDQVIAGNDEVHKRIVTPLIIPGHGDAALLQGPCNKLYRNSLIQEHKLLFSHLPYAEDWLFNVEFLMNAKSVAFLDEQLYFYDRTTEGSLSKSWRKDSFENTVWVQNKLASLFPYRYTIESQKLGVLGIQEECLKNYVYYCGIKGFFHYASQLFSNEDLVDAYRTLTHIPNRYRFTKKCVLRGWKKFYCLWCVYIVKAKVVKYFIRSIVRK